MKPVVVILMLALTAVLPVIFDGCGKSSEEQQTEAVRKSAGEPQKGTAGGDANVKAVEPVSVRDLIALLQAPLGWVPEKPTGERLTAPVNFADASLRMMKGEATVTAKITDSAFNQLLMAPFAASLDGSHDRETSDGYEKAVKVGDSPGFERWYSGTKTGNLMVVVNKRFIVEIDGSSIEGPKVLHEIVDKIDLKKLADLK